MALFGIDTSGVATPALSAQAASLIGGPPRFWGRYFNGTSSTTYQYQTSENAVLHQLGIPVLCLARQMKFVGDPAHAAAGALAEAAAGTQDRIFSPHPVSAVRDLSPVAGALAARPAVTGQPHRHDAHGVG